MDGNGRVHPDCPNAANPYHECGGLCLEKIAEGKGPKAKETKKSLSKSILSFFICSVFSFLWKFVSFPH